MKEDKVTEVVTKYFAKFLGLVDKKEPMEIIRYEDDVQKTKERKLTFPIGEWVEIQQFDVAFFQKKAINDFWEFDKKLITVKPKKSEEAEEPKKKGKSKKEPEKEPEIVATATETKEDEP